MSDIPARARRLGLQIAAVLIALLAVVVLLTLWFYERNEHAAADRDLRAAVRSMTPGDTLPGFWVVTERAHTTVTDSFPRGLPVEADLDRVRSDNRPRQREVDAGGHTYFVRTAPRGDVVVQVAMDRTGAEETTRRVITALALAGGVGVVLAAAVAAWLARRAFAPVGEALAMQRRFISDAGHELRTPVTLLSTRVQLLARRMLQQPAVPDDVHADVQGVVADTAALGDILEGLLVAADPGATDERNVIDLSVLVAACADAARASSMERGRVLTFRRSDPARVRVSSGAVRRAVTALLDNAIDHARSTVQVDVVREGRDAVVRVVDDGPGVDHEHEERIFGRFASDRSSDDRRRHYGLGLALVAEVAAAHGGTVFVQDRDDSASGAVFVLSLPSSE